MPMINLYFYENEHKHVVYRLFDRELSSLILNAGSTAGVRLLSEIDDQAPVFFSGVDEYSCLINELLLIAANKNIFKVDKVGPSFVELMTIVKFALWNSKKSLLEFSGVGVPLGEYPIGIPEELRQSLGVVRL